MQIECELFLASGFSTCQQRANHARVPTWNCPAIASPRESRRCRLLIIQQRHMTIHLQGESCLHFSSPSQHSLKYLLSKNICVLSTSYFDWAVCFSSSVHFAVQLEWISFSSNDLMNLNRIYFKVSPT